MRRKTTWVRRRGKSKHRSYRSKPKNRYRRRVNFRKKFKKSDRVVFKNRKYWKISKRSKSLYSKVKKDYNSKADFFKRKVNINLQHKEIISPHSKKSFQIKKETLTFLKARKVEPKSVSNFREDIKSHVLDFYKRHDKKSKHHYILVLDIKYRSKSGRKYRDTVFPFPRWLDIETRDELMEMIDENLNYFENRFKDYVERSSDTSYMLLKGFSIEVVK